MTLEQIKDDVAKDNGYKSWVSIYLMEITDRLYPEVCKRYATACVKASLENQQDFINQFKSMFPNVTAITIEGMEARIESMKDNIVLL